MDLDLLDSDELEVELSVRDLDSGDVRAKSLLHAMLAEEASGCRNPPTKRHAAARTLTGELAEVQRKMVQISTDLDAGSSGRGDVVFQRCRSRLVHLHGRVSRVRPQSGHHAQLDRIDDELEGLFQRCQALAVGTHEKGGGAAALEAQSDNLMGLLKVDNHNSRAEALPQSSWSPNLLLPIQSNVEARVEVLEFRPSAQPEPAVNFNMPWEMVVDQPARPFQPPVVQSGPRIQAGVVPSAGLPAQHAAAGIGLANGWTMVKWPLRYGGSQRDMPVYLSSRNVCQGGKPVPSGDDIRVAPDFDRSSSDVVLGLYSRPAECYMAPSESCFDFCFPV